MILTTQHHTAPDGPDIALLVDIRHYDAAIRQEYDWMPEAAHAR